MEASALNGKDVITANAYTLGDVNGVQVDTDTWTVTHLDVTLTKEATEELGFKKPFLGSISICLPVNIVKAIGDVITLNKSLEELKNLEECKSD
ncbi:MAG: PRC-barrel domain-containing protein [Candidatus Bathyarchaeota archaeon]|nr:MAG: PRC-barrel domain-containing protein [Candidatus Bathyarchaeota archaeon]